MKRKMLVYIAVLLGSLVLSSADCNKYPPSYYFNNSLVGSWDYTGYTNQTFDSTSNIYNLDSSIYLFDTTFPIPHTHINYQFKPMDSVIYTDYTVIPNVIKMGTYSTLSLNVNIPNAPGNNYQGLILRFPLSKPDTILYSKYADSSWKYYFVLTYDTSIGNHMLKQHSDYYYQY
jgi:hypothetical protein